MRLVLTGLRAWLVQRATAVYLLAFIVYFIAHFLRAPPTDDAAWRAYVGQGYVRLLIVAAFAALRLHAWIGLRDVMLDYVKPLAVRVVALPLVAGGLLAIGLWMLVTLASLR
jgi:succinate dehydrogenase / fumarate reductase membrane anchor subunit